MRSRISRWWLVLAILLGMLLGGLLADFIGQWLPMARLGLEIGNVETFHLNTTLLQLDLKIILRFNLGSLIGLLIGIICFRFFDN